MFHIDGSTKSGSGTILRYAIALASLLGEELRVSNIRAKREKPGLRPQHLASVRACAQMCQAQVDGVKVGSREILYRPGNDIKGGHYQFEIGTAGSTTLLTMTLLPLALFANSETSLTITGGLFQDFAPSAHYMKHVLFPTLSKMSIEAQLDIIRPGYVPGGGGIIKVRVRPVAGGISTVKLPEQGKIREVKGFSLSSHLRQQQVSQRMAIACKKVLSAEGYLTRIDTLWDDSSLQAGASLAIWAETESGCLFGADQAGRQGRRAESIGQYVAQNLLEDLKAGATVDRYLSDQLIIYAALAEGTTEYVIPRLTDHVETNRWLIEKFGARTHLEGSRLRIEGLGYMK